MLAWLAAAASLWLGARRHSAASARGYRWLAGAAGLYCAALIIAQGLGPALSPDSGLSFADLPSLLAVAAAAVGIWTLATAETGRGRATAARGDDGTPLAAQPAPMLPGLADGYVAAVALLVIGWITLFSSEFHRSGERPGTFLLALVHPLADLAVLGVLLPLVTSSWRRVLLPYAALLAVLAGRRPGRGPAGAGRGARCRSPAAGAGGGAAACRRPVAGAGPDELGRPGPEPGGRHHRRRADGRRGRRGGHRQRLAGGSVSGDALLVVSGAGVLVLAARVFMLARQNAMILGIWRESSHSLRELASRTNDVVLVCDTGRRHQLRQPGGRRLRLLPRRAVRAAAAGFRPS